MLHSTSTDGRIYLGLGAIAIPLLIGVVVLALDAFPPLTRMNLESYLEGSLKLLTRNSFTSRVCFGSSCFTIGPWNTLEKKGEGRLCTESQTKRLRHIISNQNILRNVLNGTCCSGVPDRPP